MRRNVYGNNEEDQRKNSTIGEDKKDRKAFPALGSPFSCGALPIYTGLTGFFYDDPRLL